MGLKIGAGLSGAGCVSLLAERYGADILRAALINISSTALSLVSSVALEGASWVRVLAIRYRSCQLVDAKDSSRVEPRR